MSEFLKSLINEHGAGDLEGQDLKVLSSELKSKVDEWSVVHYADDFRWHMGASIIGNECDRAIWYNFRWAVKDNRNGRMKRLHARGHSEELKFEAILEGLGFQVWSKDPSTGKQFRISLHNGHFGGSCDGLALHPPSWNRPGLYLPEWKTSGTGSKFSKLFEDGVEKTNEQHFTQQSVYGLNLGAKYSIYGVVNKNDDDLYFEYTKLSETKARWAENRAYDIIVTDYAPARIPGAKESFFKCRMCDYKDVCHNGVPMEINCRSCVYASPVQNAEWRCNKYGQDIPKEFVYKACPDYKAIA